MEIFTPTFYTWMRQGSLRSAREIMPILRKYVQPKRVVDVACGAGEWLQVFRENGADTVLGLDAPWVQENRLAIAQDEFRVIDITKPITVSGEFDMALMLEAVQHVPAIYARDIVRTLTGLAPAVLFSAPIPYQGGSGDDVHEQWPAYWAGLFSERGFVCLDVVRREIWNNEDVEWWYSQNMLLLVRKDQLETNDAMRAAYEANQSEPLRMIHPKLYESRSIPYEPQSRPAVERIARGAYRRFRTALTVYKSLLVWAVATPTTTALHLMQEFQLGIWQFEVALSLL